MDEALFIVLSVICTPRNLVLLTTSTAVSLIRSMTGPRFPEVNNDLLCLVNIEDQVIDFTLVHHVFHLVPVG